MSLNGAGDSAFANASGLLSVTIPETVKTIVGIHKYHPTEKTPDGLPALIIAEDNPHFWTDGRALYTKNRKTLLFMVDDSPEEYTVQAGATTIGDGSLDAWLYIPEGNFQMDFYTQLSITYAPAREFACYDEGYLPSLEPLRDALERIAADRAEPRMEEMRLYLTDQIADGKQQLADGRKELDDAKQQLLDAQKAIDDARAELEEGRKDLERGEDTLRNEIAAGREQLASSQEAYEEGLAQYQDYYAQYEDGRAELAEQENRFELFGSAI